MSVTVLNQWNAGNLVNKEPLTIHISSITVILKDNSTMDKTEAQIVSYGILYLNPSSHQCQPPYKKYIAV